MGEVVNLRMARKRKARVGKERDAQEKRTVHGLSRVERQQASATRDRDGLKHEGHRRERPGGEES